MSIRNSMAVSFGAAVITIAWVSPAWATRCDKEVDNVHAAVLRLIGSQAGYGVTGQESPLSTSEGQLAGRSTALTETEIGKGGFLSQILLQLAKARALDAAGDQLECIMAVKSAQKKLERSF